MNQNKSSKYLKYAVGEIILVVIGILIALQINNWNEKEKTKALAKKYISDIRSDLMHDTLTFNTAIKRLNITINQHETLLNPDLKVRLPLDSLYSIISTCFHSIRVYKIDNATYLKLSNTGFLNSEAYPELFEAINSYYNKEYTSYSEYIEWDEEQTIDILHPDFLGSFKNTVNMLDYQGSVENTKQFNNFINSNEFINMTWANRQRKNIVYDRLLFQKELATNLIEKINLTL